jgi:steroid 5-alpha reductase family enzyme
VPTELVPVCVLCAAIATACWLLSVFTREYSWVDRAWSLTPILYVGYFAARAPAPDPRLLLMIALVALWGGRLTYNFARKGGYRRGGEDYRWAELRRRMPRRAFAVFNVMFIAGYQNLLLLLISLPAWIAYTRIPTPLGPLDAAAGIAFVGLLVGETVADQQQWAFQSRKQALRERGEAISEQFVTTGLFRYSRHPNFFCEQGMWWAFYGFGVAAGAPWLNPTIIGPTLLTLLFLGSTAFTESITLARYPEYAAYQRAVSRLIPWRPRRV